MNFLNRKTFFSPVAVGYVVFFVMLVFSMLFYLERVCYGDIAFQTFTIINTKNVFYQLDRFGTSSIHICPLLAVLLELPLKYVLLSYSMALILQNLLFYWLLHKILKQKEIALVLVLYNVLMVTETFYWATNEVQQGFSYCVLFTGIMRAAPVENYKSWEKYALMLLFTGILITTIFLHPLVVLTVIFLLGYFFLQSNLVSRQTLLWCAVIVVLIVSVRYLFLPLHGHDKDQVDLKENFITFFPGYFTLPSFRRFIAYCWKDWYLYGLMFFSVMAVFIRKKEFMKLIWLILYSVGYLLLINVTHPSGMDRPLMESYYMALGIFVLYPFVFEVLPRWAPSQVIIVLSLIFVLRLNTIFHAHHSYTQRLELIRETLTAHKGKFIVPENYFSEHKLKMAWSAAYESALLSSISSPDSCRSFVILKDTADFKYAALNNGYSQHLYSVFGAISYAELNPDYFRPVPGNYRVLTRDEFAQEKSHEADATPVPEFLF